jgi:HAD superfamily hydrolase (TIGR01509 family)
MTLDIPAGDFAGYIFDCDGTLIDTMPLHFVAWSEALRTLGARTPLDEDHFYSLGGVPTRRVAELFIAHHGVSAAPMELFHLKESLFVKSLSGVKLIEPVIAFAREVAKTHPVSVASGGPRDVVHRSLQLAGLAGLFPIVITADDVIDGKPAPDMFLLAADKMGVEPKRCLVFEDAEPGIQAAQAAGMQCVRVASR